MKDVLRLAGAQIRVTLRERVSLFWFLVFPLLLLTLLTLIFSGLGEDPRMTFDIALFQQSVPQAEAPDFAGIVEHVFTDASKPVGDRPPLFRLTIHAADAVSRYEEEMERLRLGRLDLVVVVPAGFNDAVLSHLGGSDEAAAPIEIYTSAGRASSTMAHDVVRQILAGVDREILAIAGRFNREAAVSITRREIGTGTEAFSYIDFLLPGIVLMGFFTAGLFSVPGTILFGREQGILKRYWVTPLSTSRFLLGFGIGHMALCGVQFSLAWLLAAVAFGARVSFFSLLPALYLVLAIVVFLAFGFLIASLAKTGNAGMAIANIVNMPMMFLGGLFFPISDLPLPLKILMMGNPLTYLADGLRTSLGVDVAVFPILATFGVPLAWILVSVAVAAHRLRLEEAT